MTLFETDAPPLKEHQVAGIDWLRHRPRALLADEPGLGKSAQLLKAAEGRTLVVAPAMVLESGTWDDEIARWRPELDVTQVSYSSVAQRGPKGRVPRDTNGFPLTPPKPQYATGYDTVICDEAHYLKGRKTSWTAAIAQIECERIHLATGTPIPNWAHEAFMILRMMWPDRARAGHELGSYWRWANQWFDVATNHFGQREIGDLRPDLTWDQFRQANWGDRMIQRLRDDCLDLPPLTRQDWLVTMSTEQARVYKSLRKDFVTWLESGVEVEAWSEPGMLVKLAKIATGLRVLDPAAKLDGKLKALATVLTDRPRPTLVVAHFRDSVDACAQVAESIGASAAVVRGGVSSGERTRAIRAFQRGEIDVLCASINTISEGMTLHQGGADQLVRVERSFTPSKNDQVDRRLHRLGVEHSIHVIDLITKNTMDQRVLQLLQEKTDQQMMAMGSRELASIV